MNLYVRNMCICNLTLISFIFACIFNLYVFNFIAGNQQLYLEDISDGKLPGKGERLTPLHITKDDRQKYTSIQNKTMAEIREIVEREIEQIRSLGYEDEATRLRGDWDGKIRTQKKQALIMFYTREVLVALDEAVNSHPLLGEFIYLPCLLVPSSWCKKISLLQ